MKSLLPFLFLVAPLVAQSPAKKQPVAKAPAGLTGYALSPILFQDAGCARDYAAALAAGGIAMREQIAKLVMYECMKKTKGIYRGVSLERRQLPGSALTIHRATLVCVTSLGECGGPLLIRDTWITEFEPTSEAVIEAAMRLAAKRREEE